MPMLVKKKKSAENTIKADSAGACISNRKLLSSCKESRKNGADYVYACEHLFLLKMLFYFHRYPCMVREIIN